MSTPTMAEVARLAGVSKPTVSRVLNGSGPVSEQTRERVQAAVASLGYRPNELARSFHRGRTTTISVVIPFVTHPSAVDIVRGMLDRLRPTPYPMTLLDVEAPADRDSHIAELHSSRRPVGAIIGMGVRPDEQKALIAADVPTVLIESSARDFSSVEVDNVAAGTLAARHLIELGHRRLGFVGDEADERFGFVSSDQRLSGFSAQLEASGPPGVGLDVVLVPHGRHEAQAAGAALLSRAPAPTAIFCPSDTQALGVLDAARTRGLSVPGDLSVLGCDDVQASADLGLSTVHVGLCETGREAAELLLWTLANKGESPRRVFMDVSLRVRSTTGPWGGGANL